MPSAIDCLSKKYTKNPAGCWIWTAAVFGNGYGAFRLGHSTIGAHKASWLLHNGIIPIGQNVLHKCDTPLCINPEHLFLGTQADNLHDMDRKGRRRSKQTLGEENNFAVLTEDRVRAIREESGTLKEVAKKYEVHFSTISRIRRGEAWRHVI